MQILLGAISRRATATRYLAKLFVAFSAIAVSTGPVLAGGPEPFPAAYRGLTVLARVDGMQAWQAQPRDDLINARLAIGADGGVMAIVADAGAPGWAARVYLYNPRGARTVLVDEEYFGPIGGPTASDGRYFTFARGELASDGNEGVYVADIGAGYAGAHAERVTDQPHSMGLRMWENPTRLADGRIAVAVRGLINIHLGGQQWGIADGFTSFTQLLASRSLDPDSKFQSLCTPAIAPGHGFVGCGRVVSGPLHYSLSDIRIDGTAMDYFASYNAFDPLPAVDNSGISVWPVTTSIGNSFIKALYVHHPQHNLNGHVWSYNGTSGVNAVLPGTTLAIRPHPAGVEVIFQGSIADGSNSEDDVALFAVSGWKDSLDADPPLQIHRIVGRRDRVRLPSGEDAWLDAAAERPLGPHLAMNRHGDVVFTARLVTVDPYNGTVDAGVGLFRLERGIFGDGFGD